MHLSARLSLSALIATTLLTGCALTNTATPGISAGAALKGNVHGGQQPVVGSHVYLFAAGTSGYGQPSISLLNSNTDGTDSLGSYVLSDANGGFSITGDYTCTTGTQVYLLAIGGNPGLPAPQTNPNLALMTNLGQCPASGSFAANIPTVAINEVTTIASVYAISGFMTDLTHVSSSGTPLALTGIANAFATTNNLVDITTGNALATTPAGNGIVPQTEINTLANILAACINSIGATSTPCSTLFSTALNGSTQPTDTVTAALNVAHNTGIGIAALYALASTTPPFAPALTAQPNDFSITLSFTGGGLNTPGFFDTNIAVDGLGNVWATGVSSGDIAEYNGATGAAISPSSGFGFGQVYEPTDVAIDTHGNAWIADLSKGMVALNGTTGAPLFGPVGNFLHRVAIDVAGNVWAISWDGDVVSEFNGNTGAVISGSNGYVLSLPEEWSIAADSSGYVWIGDANAVIKLNSANGAVVLTSTNYAEGNPLSSNSIAIDHSGFVWVGTSNGLSKLDGNTGAAISPASGYSGGGVLNGNGPYSIAIDGLGFVWGTNSQGGLSKFDGNTGAPLSPSMGYMGNDLYYPQSLAIDGSGNIWVSNYNNSGITEFVGLATPVVTPIAAGVANNTLGTRP